MSLPYSYTDTFQIYESGGIDKQDIIDAFEQHFSTNTSIKNSSISKQKIKFNHQSLFGIDYPVEIFLQNGFSKNVKYEIKLNKLILVCIVLIIFIAFFSSFSFNGFLWFSTVFTILFYIINVIVIDRYIQNLLNLCLNNDERKKTNEEVLSKEQAEWINNKSKCPACGEDVTEYDKYCPECGIKLRDNALIKPFDTSKSQGKRIKYFFKANKKS